MPAILTPTKLDEPRAGSGGHGPDDLWPDGFGGDDRPPDPERTPPQEGYRIGLWLVMASVTMLFLALASAYIFNRAHRQPIATPLALWMSTTFILVSSGALEVARRALRRRQENKFKLWIGVTTLLGLCFLVSQFFAWQQLIEAGFYLRRNFHSYYAYLFTALHGLHLVGGLTALLVVTLRPRHNWTMLRRRVATDVTALFWHFLGVLWLALFGLVFLWR